jgi:hypothetical protein
MAPAGSRTSCSRSSPAADGTGRAKRVTVSQNFKVVVTDQVFPGIDTKTLTGGQPDYPVRP